MLTWERLGDVLGRLFLGGGNEHLFYLCPFFFVRIFFCMGFVYN